MAAGGTPGTNTGVGGSGGTSPGGGAGADATGGLGGGGTYGGGGGGGGGPGSGVTGGGGGNSGAYQHTGNPGGGVSQSFIFTNPIGSVISGGSGGQGSHLYGSGGGGGGGAGVGGGGGGGGGGYGLGGGGGGGGGGAGVGGGGGAGGYGASGVGGTGGNITGIFRITNNGKIYGGNGAAGVNYSLNPLQHGTAGDGGDAIGNGGGGGLGGGISGVGGIGGQVAGLATTIINTGLLQGGNGGPPSPGLTTGGGVGGVGIRGSNLTIVNSGTIAGGLDGNTGTVRSNAILFTGGTNSLELQSGWVISGNVGNASGVTGTINTLILGGSSSNLLGGGTATATVFDVSQIGAKYQNFNAFQKSGTGTWQLTSATGVVTPWTITGGTLQISNDAALGSTAGALTFGGTDADTGLPGSGTLAVTATTSTTRDVVLNPIAGFANTIDVSGTNTYTIGGVISGQGALTKADSGTLALIANNTYSGGTTISAGTLQIGNGGASGSITGDVTDDGALVFDRSDTYDFGGVISGTGAVQQIGAGTTVLTGDNTYTGGTTISAGTLQLGNGGSSGSITGNVADKGTLAFDRSDTYDFGGVISGTGAVQQIGAGTTVLTGNNTYTGGTTISAGTLQLGNGGSSGSITGSVTDNGTLAFDRSDTYDFSGVISGTGAVQQIGAGTTVLTAANTYTGMTTVSAGTLQAGASGAFSPGSNFVVASGATLDANGISQTIAGLTNAGVVATNLHGTSTGTTLTVTGNYTGNNGRLVLNTLLNAGGPLSNQFTDRMLVTGDPIGNTSLIVRAAGSGAVTGAFGPTGIPNAVDGISLVQVAGASTANAFTLPGGYISGGTPFQYKLYAYGPGSPNGPAAASQDLVGNANGYWDYRLQNAYVSPAGPVSPGAPLTLPNTRPAVVPQVPAYISAPTALFYANFQDLDELHRRLGEIRDAQQQGMPQQGEFFVRGFGNTFDYKSTKSFGNFGFNFSGDYSAVQFGGNWIGLDREDGKLRVGLATTLGSLRYQPSAVDGQSKGDANTVTVAGMLTWQSRLGWYVDAIVSGGWFTGKATTPQRGKTTSLDGNSFDLSLETGYPLQTGWYDLIVEPEAQMTYQRLDFAHKIDIDNINVDLGSPDQAVFRAGGRVLRHFAGPSQMQLTPYFEVNLLQGIGGSNKVTLSNVGFSTGQLGTAVEFRAGMTGTLTHNVSLYGDVAREQNVSSGGFRGWAFNGGMRYDF